MQKGRLFLIPNVLAENTAEEVIPPQVREVIKNTSYYLVENLRTARRYISSLKLGLVIDELKLEILDKKTGEREIGTLMDPALKGHDIGVISEAGCPGIADPGAMAVAFAHRNGIQVVPLTGPSSMFLALMASGFNGQSFTFHGYLPIDKKARIAAIKSLESESARFNRTQLFMETPFRNQHLYNDLLNTLNPSTKLCIAKNITAADARIQTKTIAEWKKTALDLHKYPTVFLIFAV